MTPARDLTRLSFGRLTVVERKGSRKTKLHMLANWLCQCECGNFVEKTTTALTSGKSKSCGCLKSDAARHNLKLANDAWKLNKGVAATNRVFYDYKRHAKDRGLEFCLTKDEFVKMSQNMCHYCGSVPSNCRDAHAYNGSFAYNGIDRIDNSLGYTVENCVPCCKQCNMGKKTMGLDEFTSWVYRIYTHMELQDA